MKSAEKIKKEKHSFFLLCLLFLVQLTDQQVVALTRLDLLNDAYVTCCSIQHYYTLVLTLVESRNTGS